MVQCEADKKVIDYNELIAEKLSKIKKKSDDRQESKADSQEEGFKAGLIAREVEITEEENQEPEIDFEERINDAKEEADRILEEARKQAEEIKQQAYQEASKIGYDEGYQQAISDVDDQKAKLEEQKSKLIRDYQEQLNEMEPKLVDAITEVVQDVFKIKFEDNKKIIVHLAKIALGQMKSSKEFIVKVSKADYPFLLKYKEVLDKSISKASNINIVEDSTLLKNQCLIETDGGVFDCSLDVQLDNLTKTLKILSRN